MIDTAIDAGKVVLKVLVFFGALSKILYTLAKIFEMLADLTAKPVKQ